VILHLIILFLFVAVGNGLIAPFWVGKFYALPPGKWLIVMISLYVCFFIGFFASLNLLDPGIFDSYFLQKLLAIFGIGYALGFLGCASALWCVSLKYKPVSFRRLIAVSAISAFIVLVLTFIGLLITAGLGA